jgi:glycosyltransferase involved in cell wall biosynthesis
MRILHLALAFHPNIGGLEAAARQLSHHWAARGHEVCVLTRTALGNVAELDEGYRVRRDLGPGAFVEELRRCEIFVQSGFSLRWVAGALMRPGRSFAILQTYLGGEGVRASDTLGALKRAATRLVHSIAVSRSVVNSARGSCSVIPNPFRIEAPAATTVARQGVLIVARLVSDKGVDLALEALARSHARGAPWPLIVVGHGPEREHLDRTTDRLGLRPWVSFRGALVGTALADAYRAADVVLVPSRIEPFGIVVLEALAHGCRLIVSDAGGLPEALGGLGRVIARGDVEAIADVIEAELAMPTRPADDAVRAHLERHSVAAIGDRYLELFAGALGRSA